MPAHIYFAEDLQVFYNCSNPTSSFRRSIDDGTSLILLANVFNRTTTNYLGECFSSLFPFTKYIKIEIINNLW